MLTLSSLVAMATLYRSFPPHSIMNFVLQVAKVCAVLCVCVCMLPTIVCVCVCVPGDGIP